MRLARDFGDIHELLPPGTSLRDAPYSILEAIRLAQVFISWLELPDDECPPRSIWLNHDRLADHFAGVERKREEQSGQRPAVEDPVDNLAAKDLIVGD